MRANRLFPCYSKSVYFRGAHVTLRMPKKARDGLIMLRAIVCAR
jgi:hypothetical protein